MRKLAILIVFLLLLVNIAQAQYIIKIDVNESGNALWTIEKRLPFTKTEIKEWEGIIASGQNMTRSSFVAELNDLINQFNISIQNFSNRSMEIEGFNSSNISYSTEKTAADSFGIIRYSFLWKNFSTMESGKIYIGDAFLGGNILSSENALIINIPESYKVINSTPAFDKQDGSRIIWEGKLYRNFSIGEPSLILSKINATNATGINETSGIITPEKISWPLTLIFGIITGLIAGIFLMFLKRRLSKNKAGFFNDLIKAPKDLQELLQVPAFLRFLNKEFGAKGVQELKKAAEEHRLKTSSEDTSLNEESEDDNGPIEPITDDFIGYEEKIEQFLSKSGGQAFQSDIVKEIGLSKSKISNLLADMKEKGRIIKIKRGKENIIRLVINQTTSTQEVLPVEKSGI
jgi:hypothetical protein